MIMPGCKPGIIYLDSKIFKDEGVDISLLFKDLGERFASAVSRLGVDTYQTWIRS